MFGWLKRRITRWILLRRIRAFVEAHKESEVMQWLKNILSFFGLSKKATVVLAGLLMIVFRDVLGVDPELAKQIVELILSYLIAQGAVDVALVVKGKKGA